MNLFRINRPLNDLDSDIRDHIARETEDNVARGMSPSDARLAALRKFGNVSLAKEETRAVWLSVRLEQLIQDLRFAIRTLRKSAGFTIAVVLTLALGIGVNTSIFSLLYSLALRPLPVKDSASIVSVYEKFRGHFSRGDYGMPSLLSYPEYVNFRDSALSFTGLAAFADDSLSLGGSTGESVPALLASCNYFEVLGAEIAHGRGFSPDDCRTSGSSPIVVLNYSFWTARFSADPAAVGKTLILNRRAFTIIGVASKNFGGTELQVPDIWIPLSMASRLLPNEFKNPDWLAQPNVSWLNVVGRLRPGRSRAAAESELAILASRVDQNYPGRQTLVSVNSGAFFNSPEIRGQGSAAAAAVLALAAFILLIACTNVMNLLLSRAASRQQEIEMRVALGAGHIRLLRQLLTETLLLALLGGAASVLVADWLPPLLVHAVPETPDTLQANFAPNLAILAYAFVVTLIAAAISGLAPAWRAIGLARHSSSNGIAVISPRHSPRSRLRSSLIVIQVAGSAVLLVAAALLVRGLHYAETQSPGFATRDVAIISPDLANAGYDAPRADAFLRQFQDRLSAIPGVAGAARSAVIPGVTGYVTTVTIPGAASNETALSISGNLVSARYFQTMDIRLIRGRFFSESDSRVPGSLPAVISSAMARALWPASDPLDKTFLIANSAYRVVGVAHDAQNVRLGQADGPFFYAAMPADAALDARIFVRAPVGLPAIESAARQIARQLDPNLIISTEPLEAALNKTLTPSKTLATLVGVMGLLAMLLAVVGVWGVVAYAVARRTREIGIRKALGARTPDVLSLLLRSTIALVAIGLGIGLALGAAASRILSSAGLLFGLSALDPATYLTIGLCFATVALIASYLPARRATRLDPLTALRHE